MPVIDQLPSPNLQPLSKFNLGYLSIPEISNDHQKAVITKLSFTAFKKPLLSPINLLFVNGRYRFSGLLTNFNNTPLQKWKQWYLFSKFRFLTKIEHHHGTYLWAHDIWSNNYYHWLCETLPRIFLMSKENKSAQVILPEVFQNLSFVSNSLDLLNIPYKWINNDCSHRFEKLITIDTDPPLGNVNPTLQSSLRDELFAKLNISHNSSANRKIYISRAQAKYRKIKNEDQLIEILEQNGYEIIRTETMSFAEQIKIFSEAKSVIAQHGAGLANIMFLRPGSTLVEIRQPNWKAHPLCFWRLANIFDLKWYYFESEMATEISNFADYTIDKQKFSELLKELE